MAHELAHARKHHIFWMLFVLIVTLGAIEQLMLLLLAAIEESISPWSTGVVRQAIQDPDTQTYIIALPAFAITMLVFGWVSRRIERQADVFAARYLAQTTDSPEKNEIGKPIFDATSVGTMIRALQRVADLNHIPVMRKSWRHGSIAWRQDHLRSLIGKPIDRPEIDLVIGRIKAAALTGAILIALAYFWQYTESGESTPAQPTPASTSPAIIPDSL